MMSIGVMEVFERLCRGLLAEVGFVVRAEICGRIRIPIRSMVASTSLMALNLIDYKVVCRSSEQRR